MGFDYYVILASDKTGYGHYYLSQDGNETFWSRLLYNTINCHTVQEAYDKLVYALRDSQLKEEIKDKRLTIMKVTVSIDEAAKINEKILMNM